MTTLPYPWPGRLDQILKVYGSELLRYRWSSARGWLADENAEVDRTLAARADTLSWLGLSVNKFPDGFSRRRFLAEAEPATPDSLVQQIAQEQRIDILPDVLEKYADLELELDGSGQLNNRWQSFDPCTINVGQKCNAGAVPTVTPEFQLRALARGTISDRFHINVDFDQTREFNATNDLNVYYEGKPGEIIEFAEVGQVTLPLPRSQYLSRGIPAGNFGFRGDARLGPLTLRGVLAEQEGNVLDRNITIDVGRLGRRKLGSPGFREHPGRRRLPDGTVLLPRRSAPDRGIPLHRRPGPGGNRGRGQPASFLLGEAVPARGGGRRAAAERAGRSHPGPGPGVPVSARGRPHGSGQRSVPRLLPAAGGRRRLHRPPQRSVGRGPFAHPARRGACGHLHRSDRGYDRELRRGGHLSRSDEHRHGGAPGSAVVQGRRDPPPRRRHLGQRDAQHLPHLQRERRRVGQREARGLTGSGRVRPRGPRGLPDRVRVSRDFRPRRSAAGRSAGRRPDLASQLERRIRRDQRADGRLPGVQGAGAVQDPSADPEQPSAVSAGATVSTGAA